jgi:3',5'-cyclic AMP phosphodiesterase CpdA
MHFGAEEPALLGPLMERLRAIGPDLIVASGDFTMAGRHREFRAAASFLARMPAPVVATPGNHDLPVYDLVERFTDPFRRYRRSIEPITLTEFISPEIALLALNSARRWDLSLNWSHGRLSDGQVREADRFFARNSGSRIRALVVHHPFFVPEELPGFRQIGNGDAMLEVLARRRVHAVLSGHLHQQAVAMRELIVDEEARSVVLLQVASATSTRRRNQPNAFNVMDVEGETIAVIEQIERDGRFEPQPRRVVWPVATGPAPEDSGVREPGARAG